MTDSADSIKEKLTDMNEDFLKEVKVVIYENLKKHTNERDTAYQIKREMDKKYTGPWHCVLGRNFGVYVTHEEGYYLQALKGQMTIVLWK